MKWDEVIEKWSPLSDYERGLADGLYMFSIMRDGTLYVGSGIYTAAQGLDRAIREHRQERREPERSSV